MPIIVRKKKKRTATNGTASAGNGSDHRCPNDDLHNEQILQLKSKETIVLEVRHAISTLQRGIRKMLFKTKSITSLDDPGANKLNDILRHIEHCMVHLQQHVNVLQIGMHCYMYKLLPHIYNTVTQQQSQEAQSTTLASSSDPKKKNGDTRPITFVKNIIQHLFYWLLHLHDGYIYTISGECRHIYDQKQHRKHPKMKNKFQSHLNIVPNKGESSKDEAKTILPNSSKLYSPDNIYSGTSWDEYMDPINGLRHRLLRTILNLQQYPQRPSKSDDYEVLWDTMIEDVSSPGYALEHIVTQIEQQMQQVQMMFTKLTKSSGTMGDNYFCQMIQKTLVLLLQSHGVVTSTTTTTTTPTTNTTIPTVALHWKDKMESLRITSSTFGTIVLERYGNTFQTMKMNESILPLQYTSMTHWWKQGGMELVLPLTSGTQQNVTNKKQRRVICINDDDEEDHMDSHRDDSFRIDDKTKTRKVSSTPAAESNPQTNCGLTVKMIVDCMDPPAKKEQQHKESVNEIKVQFGVNIHDRENAYDIIQAEEAGATYDAEQIDHDEYMAGSTSLQMNDDYRNHTNEGEELYDVTIDDEIHYAMQRLKRTKRSFLRLLKDASRSGSENRKDDEINDNNLDINIWNAREVLREAYMMAGDVLLWSVERRKEEEQNKNDVGSSKQMQEQDYIKTLQNAIQLFRVAKELVVQQQKLHKIMNPDPSHDPIHYTFFGRNLLLLQTKAQINIGIGYLQLGKHGYPSDRDPYRQVQFHSAVKECQTAYDLIVGMDQTSFLLLPDHDKSDDDEQTIRRDWLEALQLRVLATRWTAMALWYLHKKSESFGTIDKISSSLEHHHLVQNGWTVAYQVSNVEAQKNDMTGVMDSLIDFHLEIYCAWTMIADLASQSLERATVASVQESDQSKSFYDTLLNYVVRALSKAAKLSRTLKHDLERSNLMERYKALCDDNRLLAADDIMDTLGDIKEWWNRRLQLADALPTNKPTYTHIERGELFSSATQPRWEDLPTRRFIIQPLHRRSKYNLGGRNGGDSTVASARPRRFGNHARKNCKRSANITSASGQEKHEHKNTIQDNPAPRPFRRWREEMTYDPNTESFVPLLVYPSIAPPIPTHIHEFLKKKSQQILPVDGQLLKK
jgi:hypothetical protein